MNLKFLEPVEIDKPIIILLVLVLISAVAVIVTKHKSRYQFAQLQQAEKARDHLNEEWGRLLLEESTWASPSRIEQQAKLRLEMIVPDAHDTVVIRP